MMTSENWYVFNVHCTHINHIIINRTPLISYFSKAYANPTSSLIYGLWVEKALRITIDKKKYHTTRNSLIIKRKQKVLPSDLQGQDWCRKPRDTGGREQRRFGQYYPCQVFNAVKLISWSELLDQHLFDPWK